MSWDSFDNGLSQPTREQQTRYPDSPRDAERYERSRKRLGLALASALVALTVWLVVAAVLDGRTRALEALLRIAAAQRCWWCSQSPPLLRYPMSRHSSFGHRREKKGAVTLLDSWDPTRPGDDDPPRDSSTQRGEALDREPREVARRRFFGGTTVRSDATRWDADRWCVALVRRGGAMVVCQCGGSPSVSGRGSRRRDATMPGC